MEISVNIIYGQLCIPNHSVMLNMSEAITIISYAIVLTL